MLKILIILFILLLIFIVIEFFYIKESFEGNTNIQLVISRYNENLEWLKGEPFSKYQNIIYNKGPNDDFYSNENSTIVKLDNIGCESHTYIYHIINNYDNIAHVTIFLPGSVDAPYKYTKAKTLIEEVENHKDTVFISEHFNNVKDEFYNFYLDEYLSYPTRVNKSNREIKLFPSKIRPFGKWFESMFGDIVIHNMSVCGIIGIGKNDIIQHPREHYEKLYQEFNENSPNLEVGHYFERSWEAVFYPFNNPKYIATKDVLNYI